MTTAHRPTWAPAKGHEEQGGARYFGPSKQYSARDLASHTELKERKSGQSTLKDLEKRDLKTELEDKERKHFSKRSRRDEGADNLRLEAAKAKEIESRLQPKLVDADDSADELEDDDDSDDEDDTEELMKELERIKKERAEEAGRKQAEIDKADQAVKSSELARGNPLISSAQAGSFNMKRRWDDDVVFKNQARNEPKQVQRFINDTIRNDFHRRFLTKYMK
mmetsp:Transcript_4411/g.5940  ORF Transcript_4411/g.5940 Transcript_4411/m.5940 type:complete len:222 (+) Transcript_4411:162-827(+)|eukprot:CAMPEP_0196595106 /NCGR_PEP_ID=MMETSP1081-20130531/80206_1 /TAXON_ID=36882 /ORGANISM="Pyramimonas amylifera, Strain CCMP720" /LENGTH=221 /DNA_ID=CAMNT_0041919569 /DNA_START=145 /DNA_END=810 /DNA_ORIENTATION=+